MAIANDLRMILKDLLPVSLEFSYFIFLVIDINEVTPKH